MAPTPKQILNAIEKLPDITRIPHDFEVSPTVRVREKLLGFKPSQRSDGVKLWVYHGYLKIY
ncbi:MAG: hypothetical protein HC908_01675 [Calothrix sp. SM1_7_51]|nr:hypothetical protein [Calothrix sp. SM1_7_51]